MKSACERVEKERHTWRHGHVETHGLRDVSAGSRGPNPNGQACMQMRVHMDLVHGVAAARARARVARRRVPVSDAKKKGASIQWDAATKDHRCLNRCGLEQLHVGEDRERKSLSLIHI